MNSSANHPRTATDITVRLASAQEFGRVSDLLIDAFSSTFEVPDFYASDLRDVRGHAAEFNVWVACRDSEILGVVFTAKSVLASDQDSERDSEQELPWERGFRMLAVSPRARGQGLSRLLIDHAVRELGSLGVRTVSIGTGLRMKSARRLYEAYGFRRRPEREWFLVDGGYRAVTYTYDIPPDEIAPNPAFDEIESRRKPVPVPDVPGSIPGFLQALARQLPADVIDTSEEALAAAKSDRSTYSER